MLPAFDTTVRFPAPVVPVVVIFERVTLSFAVALTLPPFVVIEEAGSIVITLAFVPGLAWLESVPAFKLTFKAPAPVVMDPVLVKMMSFCALRVNVAVLPLAAPPVTASLTVMDPPAECSLRSGFQPKAFK